jgi:hypothetical protein
LGVRWFLCGGKQELRRPAELLACVLMCVACTQVLQKDYAHAADVWSAGVIMFILLSGYPPFSGSNDARILQRVQQGSYSFAAREVSRRWADSGLTFCKVCDKMCVNMHMQRRAVIASIMQRV